MCLWNTEAPGGNKVKLWQKSLSPTFWPDPQGHVTSVKCEQPLDELTVQVWLLYDHPNFKYCTLFISVMELRTDGQTDKTDDQNTRCPRWIFQGHNNSDNACDKIRWLTSMDDGFANAPTGCTWSYNIITPTITRRQNSFVSPLWNRATYSLQWWS